MNFDFTKQFNLSDGNVATITSFNVSHTNNWLYYDGLDIEIYFSIINRDGRFDYMVDSQYNCKLVDRRIFSEIYGSTYRPHTYVEPTVMIVNLMQIITAVKDYLKEQYNLKDVQRSGDDVPSSNKYIVCS